MWRGLKFGIPYDFSSTSLHNIMLFRNFSLSGASVVPSPLKVVSWCWYDKMQQAFCEVWACFPISEVKYTYMDILQSSKSCQKTFYLPTIFRTAGHTDFWTHGSKRRWILLLLSCKSSSLNSFAEVKSKQNDGSLPFKLKNAAAI